MPFARYIDRACHWAIDFISRRLTPKPRRRWLDDIRLTDVGISTTTPNRRHPFADLSLSDYIRQIYNVPEHQHQFLRTMERYASGGAMTVDQVRHAMNVPSCDRGRNECAERMSDDIPIVYGRRHYATAIQRYELPGYEIPDPVPDFPMRRVMRLRLRACTSEHMEDRNVIRHAESPNQAIFQLGATQVGIVREMIRPDMREPLRGSYDHARQAMMHPMWDDESVELTVEIDPSINVRTLPDWFERNNIDIVEMRREPVDETHAAYLDDRRRTYRAAQARINIRINAETTRAIEQLQQLGASTDQLRAAFAALGHEMNGGDFIEFMSAKPHVRAKARALLEKHLRPEQLKDFREHGWFIETGHVTKSRYRVTKKLTFNVERLNSKNEIMESYCCAPAGFLPAEDNMTAQLLALRCNETEFLNRANVTRSGEMRYHYPGNRWRELYEQRDPRESEPEPYTVQIVQSRIHEDDLASRLFGPPRRHELLNSRIRVGFRDMADDEYEIDPTGRVTFTDFPAIMQPDPIVPPDRIIAFDGHNAASAVVMGVDPARPDSDETVLTVVETGSER